MAMTRDGFEYVSFHDVLAALAILAPHIGEEGPGDEAFSYNRLGDYFEIRLREGAEVPEADAALLQRRGFSYDPGDNTYYWN